MKMMEDVKDDEDVKAPEQSKDDKTSWKPTQKLSSTFLKKWPGVLGSTKWRTPEYVVNLVGDKTLVEIKRTDKLFLELGCGDARVLINVAKRFPFLQCEGYEINTLVHKEAQARVKESGLENVTVHLESAYRARVSDADVIYVYSNRRGLHQLHSLLCRLKPGARLILYQNDVKSPIPNAERRRVRCQDPKNELVVWPVYIYTRKKDIE